MAEIFGNTTTTPINPDMFSGGGDVRETVTEVINEKKIDIAKTVLEVLPIWQGGDY